MLTIKEKTLGTIYKPLLFALLGALGCLLGAIIGELALVFLLSASPQQQVDVLFVLDVTGSMQQEIDGVQAGIDDFVSQLAGLKLNSRVGLIAFRDRFIGEEPKILSFAGGDTFTDNVEAFSRKVRELNANGGGDNPESSLDALVLAARQPFRKDANKIIILITDAAPHIPDRETVSVQQATQIIKQNHIDQLHLVIADSDAPLFAELQAGAPGKIFSLAKTAAERKGFDKVLPQIGRQIALAVGTQSIAAKQFLPVLLAIALWTACLAVGIFLALVMGQNRYLNRPLLPLNIGMLGSIAGVLIAGALAGALGQLFYSGVVNFKYFATMGRVIAWAILGAILGRGIAFFIPNLSPRRAFLGGIIGGVVGAIGFAWVTGVGIFSGYSGDIIGRFTGAAILGFFIGLMISLIEVIFREAWLEVNYGPKESRTVNLGAEPVSIGSDQNNCTIYSRSAAPVAYIYQLQQGQITCRDAVSGVITVVQPGYQQRVGNAVVTVQSGKKQVQAVPATVSSPSSGPVSHFALHLASKPPCLLALGKRLSVQDIPGLEPLGSVPQFP